jgi:peptide-methionine (S)-S-oxide reductase
MASEKATFGAGCFWQVEAEFRNTPGVTATRVGYAGGETERPSYEQVCTDRTGHAEVVEVEFDPERVSYEQLLERFWTLHDPTQLNRQGPDVGRQYRSAIFVHSPEQEEVATESRTRAQARFRRPIVTEITPAAPFWPAEEYHQRYLEKRGMATCAI